MGDRKTALFVIPKARHLGQTIGNLQRMINECHGVIDIKVQRSDVEEKCKRLQTKLDEILKQKDFAVNRCSDEPCCCLCHKITGLQQEENARRIFKKEG